MPGDDDRETCDYEGCDSPVWWRDDVHRDGPRKGCAEHFWDLNPPTPGAVVVQGMSEWVTLTTGPPQGGPGEVGAHARLLCSLRVLASDVRRRAKGTDWPYSSQMEDHACEIEEMIEAHGAVVEQPSAGGEPALAVAQAAEALFGPLDDGTLVRPVPASMAPELDAFFAALRAFRKATGATHEPRPCHDCGVGVGEMHTHGCDAEVCAMCGGQSIGCNCVYDVCGINVGTMEETHPDIYTSGPTEEMYARWDSEWGSRRIPWDGGRDTTGGRRER